MNCHETYSEPWMEHIITRLTRVRDADPSWAKSAMRWRPGREDEPLPAHP